MASSASPSAPSDPVTDTPAGVALPRVELPRAELPRAELPKGGGAIRGTDEKFSAAAATGAGSFVVPIASSPGRSGFGPQLSLRYDSNAGNGPFGFGWTLALPSITRKTSKGLPRYRDDATDDFDADVCILSGSDDLVPVGEAVARDGFRVRRYRPRIEGLFARIERWARADDPADVHWRSISRDNVLTLYGADAASRIADPADPARIFSWLVCESRDDKGNAMQYVYRAEDGAGVDTQAAHQRNRGARDDPGRSANRYLKRIRYGNRVPLLDGDGRRPRFVSPHDLAQAGWMFELVFDYGDHAGDAPTPEPAGPWLHRTDAFSTCRAGFEVRTARRCERVLMFHHFPGEPGVGADCLVRSTDFRYAHDLDPSAASCYTHLVSAEQAGYRRIDGGYRRRSTPPIAFDYSTPAVDPTVHTVDAAAIENLPAGADRATHQWVDLHGEGLPGLLSAQAGAWFYKRNLSALDGGRVRFGALEEVPVLPNVAAREPLQFMDLAGDGRLDLVTLDGPLAGLREHDDAEGWKPFQAFAHPLNRRTSDRHLRLVDLDGDGLLDVLVQEDDAFVWHPSRGEDGFGRGEHVPMPIDEEQGPRVVFSNDEETIFFADLNGDGLTDLLRIRNGEVCYWPNLGHGRFGAKVRMDGSPQFDHPDRFDPKRIRIADIDGSGTADLIYLHADGVRLYFNQSGNAWSAAQTLPVYPEVHDLATVATVDLLGQGTSCLLWSSSLPEDAGRPMRYVDLMGGAKPHLLVKIDNHLGRETRIGYATSSRFFLEDRLAGRPWRTKLPFPVQVVERVEVVDRIGRTAFVTRYAYHHGHFDGVEREFRGFGLVEQWDAETIGTDDLPPLPLAGEGACRAVNHGAAFRLPPVLTKTWFHTGQHRSDGRVSDLFADACHCEPSLTDAQARQARLPDTVLPDGLTLDEEREACRALKGTTLRTEVYALDGSPREPHPYTVTEQNLAVRLLQPRGRRRFAVFFTHPLESVVSHCERDPGDPRVQHTQTLEVDAFGNVLRAVAIGYGRRQADPTLPGDVEREVQTRTLVTATENRFTNPVDEADALRLPLLAQAEVFELTGFERHGPGQRFMLGDWAQDAERLAYEAAACGTRPQKRLTQSRRIVYRADDLQALLPPGSLQSRALPGETLQLALTRGLLDGLLVRDGEALLPDPQAVLAEGGYREHDGAWWVPSGRTFFAPHDGDDELAWARDHFFLPHRLRDAFGAESTVAYDVHRYLPVESNDALGNRNRVDNDYRVLQPQLLTDPNRNRSALAFDTLGRVVATASMGKAGEPLGDHLDGFEPDLDDAAIAEHQRDPLGSAARLLGRATTRIVLDPFAYHRTRHTPAPQPVFAHTLSRETHVSALRDGEASRILHGRSYTDGAGREVQTKARADAGWIASGWTILNNKGLPVRRFEPFFTDTLAFEFGVERGVSPVLFHDPLGRVVATLHPDHRHEKVVFGPWQQTTWDTNDTTLAHPRHDADIGPLVAGWFETVDDDWLTWHRQRVHGALGPHEADAARKSAAHANTPKRTAADALGRTFLTVDHQRVVCSGHPQDGHEEQLATRVELDIDGHEREAIDATGRVVMRLRHDLLGRPLHQAGMDSGARWMLGDVAGQPLRSWDSRGHEMRHTYDAGRRPLRAVLVAAGEAPRLTSLIVYGERHPQAEARNLRGQAWLQLDASGLATTEAFTFRNLPRTATRRIALAYQESPDWADAARAFDGEVLDLAAIDAALAPQLEDDVYTGHTHHDALDRVVEQVTPHRPGMRPNTVRSRFNATGLLVQVDAKLGGDRWTPFITRIDYDANGRRLRVDRANRTRTFFEYDPLTFRLRRQRTLRESGTPRRPRRVQDLATTYDAVGNVTHVQDRAQQVVFFRNACVSADNEHTYDALYRLIESTGREHLGQGRAPGPNDARPGLDADDGRAMARYVERCVYDRVGNFTEVRHRGTDASHAGWTRRYAYDEASALDARHRCNRLSRTVTGDLVETFAHDVHGSMTAMPNLGGVGAEASLHWDHRDRLQRLDLGGGGTAWYVCNLNGQRVRKLWRKSTGTVEERLYLDGFEIFRRRQGHDRFERETVRIVVAGEAIALVETRTVDTAGQDDTPAQRIRHQLTADAHSVAVELDESGGLISYEEYSPYGATTYQAVRTDTHAAKRYRYAGKERDEESGLGCHGARYYAGWLGRWTAADPAGLVDGPNVYAYAKCNPIAFVDLTGADCDPTRQSCAVDPTKRTAEEERKQACIARPSPWTGAFGGGGGDDEGGFDDGAEEDEDDEEGGGWNVGGGGYRMRAVAPKGFTLQVPNSYDGVKLRAYNRGVWNGEIGLNAGPGNSTETRRRSAPQRQARADFRLENPVPPETAPGGRGWAVDHIIELQHDLTGRKGCAIGDYRWQDSALNSLEGTQSYQLQRNNPLLEPAGGVSRTGTSTRFYNTEGYRSTVRGAGTVLLVVGVAQTGDHIVSAIQADIEDGTGGRQTARAVATEAGGWSAALVVGEAGAEAGLLCGEFAPICSPILGLLGGAIGYSYGTEVVDKGIDIVPEKIEEGYRWMDSGVRGIYGIPGF